MSQFFFRKLEAGSERALLSKVNKHFEKNAAIPKEWQIEEKSNGRWVFYFFDRIGNFTDVELEDGE